MRIRLFREEVEDTRMFLGTDVDQVQVEGILEPRRGKLDTVLCTAERLGGYGRCV